MVAGTSFKDRTSSPAKVLLMFSSAADASDGATVSPPLSDF
jgi:hypothetical protein